MKEKPKNEYETAVEMYRLTSRADEVNWNARANQTHIRDYLHKVVLGDMTKFIVKASQDVTYKKREIRCVVPTSGGLDSAVAAVLVAETMRRRPQFKNSLVLMGFTGNNDKDTIYLKRFQEWFEREYSDLLPKCVQYNAAPILGGLDEVVQDLMITTSTPKKYVGESPSRFLMNVVHEYADRTEHAHVDTTNGTEIIMGEITLGAGGDFTIFSDILKTYVWGLGELLKVPEFILARNPQNTSLGNDKISTYFGEVPKNLTAQDVYAVLDPILYGLWELELSPRTIARQLGHDLKFVRRVSDRIEKQKYRQNPPFFVYTNKETVARTPKSKRNSEIERGALYESAKI